MTTAERLTYQGKGRVNRAKDIRTRQIRKARRFLYSLRWQVPA